MFKLAPYPSYSLNLLNLFDLLFDSSLSPLMPLILVFLCLNPHHIPYLFPLSKIPFVFFFLFCFVVLLPLVWGIPWNIGSGPTSIGSLSFIGFIIFKLSFSSYWFPSGGGLICSVVRSLVSWKIPCRAKELVNSKNISFVFCFVLFFLEQKK